jgi:hypothetical protein
VVPLPLPLPLPLQLLFISFLRTQITFDDLNRQHMREHIPSPWSHTSNA